MSAICCSYQIFNFLVCIDTIMQNICLVFFGPDSKRYCEGFFLHKMFPQKFFPTLKNGISYWGTNFLQFTGDFYEIAKRVLPVPNIFCKGLFQPIKKLEKLKTMLVKNSSLTILLTYELIILTRFHNDTMQRSTSKIHP